MDRKLKGKGVPIFIGAVMGVLIVLMLVSAGTAGAAVSVQNWADLIYRSSPSMATAFSYLRTDSAVLRVMYGPNMRMAKGLRNEVSGDASDYLVKVNKGDTITIMLEAWNDVVSGDSTAHHIVLYDTFALLSFYQYGNSGCLVGPDDGANSFTYVTNSESESTDGTYTAPTYIAYYDYVQKQWEGTGGNPVVLTSDPSIPANNWIPYGPNWEDQVNGIPGNANQIVGIAWYWTFVYSLYADEGDNSPYAVRVQFQIKKNDN